MTDRPILFSGPMVKALLEGRKTMTRRLAWKPAKKGEGPKPGWRLEHDDRTGRFLKPTIWQRVEPGDRLWVREVFAYSGWEELLVDVQYRERSGAASARNNLIIFRAENPRRATATPDKQPTEWRPPIDMPREDSRLTLVVTACKVERLQAISHHDAVAEGMGIFPHSMSAQKRFQETWKPLHGKGAWDANPEVVALTFTVHKTNIDAMEQAA